MVNQKFLTPSKKFEFEFWGVGVGLGLGFRNSILTGIYRENWFKANFC
jgi:hypothetical protein